MSEENSNEELTNLKVRPLTSADNKDQINFQSTNDILIQQSIEEIAKTKGPPMTAAPEDPTGVSQDFSRLNSDGKISNTMDQSADETNNMDSQDFSSQQSNEKTAKLKYQSSSFESDDKDKSFLESSDLSLNSFNSLGQIEESNKKLPPGMKRMVQVQSRNTLQEIYDELKDFIKFVQEVQKETPQEWEVIEVKPLQAETILPTASSPTKVSGSSELRKLRDVDSRPANAPIRDALQIVRNLLSKMATLIDKVASTAANTDDEANIDICSPKFNIYYAQYVFQIACYVFKIMSEHLKKFSNTLGEISMNEAIEEIPKPEYPSSSLDPNLFLYSKNNSYYLKSTNAGESPKSSERLMSKDVSDRTAYFSNNTTHTSENEIRKRLYDSIELLQLISERMLSPKEELSQFTDISKKQKVEKNFKVVNSFEIDKKLENIFGNKFSKLLKDELKKNLNEHSKKVPEKSGYTNTISIVSRIIESFQIVGHEKATETQKEISPTSRDEERDLVEIIEEFVNEINKYSLLSQLKETEIEDGIPLLYDKPRNRRKAQTEPELITIEKEVILPARPQSSTIIQDRTGIEELNECTSCPRSIEFKLSDYIKTITKDLFLSKDTDDIEMRSACNEQCLKNQVLHEKHDLLPKGKMEVRQVNDRGQVVVSLEDYDTAAFSKELINCLSLMDVRNAETRRSKSSMPERNSNVINDLLSKLSSLRVAKREELTLTSSHSDLTTIMKIGRTIHDSTLNLCKIVEKMHNLGENLRDAGYNSGPPLILKLRLENIYEEAFKTLSVPSGIPLSHYKKILIHVYEKSKESVVEDLTEEVFPILGEYFFCHQEEGPFIRLTDHSMSVYPNPASTSLLEQYRFAGILLAVAIIQNEFLGVNLPLCFYKCLLDRPLKLHDLREIDPVLHQKLKWLNENNISGRKPMFYFTIKEKVGKEAVVSELIDNGGQIAVEQNNKMFFIEKCLKRRFVERCIMQYKEIVNGFTSVLEPRFLNELKVVEIQKMIEKCPCLNGCEMNESEVAELTIKNSS